MKIQTLGTNTMKVVDAQLYDSAIISSAESVEIRIVSKELHIFGIEFTREEAEQMHKLLSHYLNK